MNDENIVIIIIKHSQSSVLHGSEGVDMPFDKLSQINRL